jgi:hypothetical protein
MFFTVPNRCILAISNFQKLQMSTTPATSYQQPGVKLVTCDINTMQKIYYDIV